MENEYQSWLRSILDRPQTRTADPARQKQLSSSSYLTSPITYPTKMVNAPSMIVMPMLADMINADTKHSSAIPKAIPLNKKPQQNVGASMLWPSWRRRNGYSRLLMAYSLSPKRVLTWQGEALMRLVTYTAYPHATMNPSITKAATMMTLGSQLRQCSKCEVNQQSGSSQYDSSLPLTVRTIPIKIITVPLIWLGVIFLPSRKYWQPDTQIGPVDVSVWIMGRGKQK